MGDPIDQPCDPLGADLWVCPSVTSRSATSRETVLVTPHIVHVVRYLVPMGMIGMKKTLMKVLTLLTTCAAGVRHCEHRASTVPSRRPLRLIPNMKINFGLPRCCSTRPTSNHVRWLCDPVVTRRAGSRRPI